MIEKNHHTTGGPLGSLFSFGMPYRNRITISYPYERDFDFQGFQTSRPSTPLPGDKIDEEYDQIAATIDEVRARIAIFQRDDLPFTVGSFRAKGALSVREHDLRI